MGGGAAGDATAGGGAVSTDGGALPRTRLKSAFARSLFLIRSASETTWTGRAATRLTGVHNGEACSAEVNVSARRRSISRQLIIGRDGAAAPGTRAQPQVSE